jgi:hypothetical protein
MRIPPLKPYVIAIIGVVLSAIAVFLIYYEMIAPTEEKITAAQARFNAAFPDSTPTKQSQAKAEKELAIKMVAQVQSEWEVQERTKMPQWDLSDRRKAWEAQCLELNKTLGESIYKWVPQTGVTMVNSVNLPPPPLTPNQIITAPMTINLGGFTVLGDFRAILAHVVKWNDFNRLAMINNLALHGNSPRMRGTYSLTVFIFPKNADKVGPLIPKIGGPGGAGGGTRGGPPPGFGAGFPG